MQLHNFLIFNYVFTVMSDFVWLNDYITRKVPHIYVLNCEFIINGRNISDSFYAINLISVSEIPSFKIETLLFSGVYYSVV